MTPRMKWIPVLGFILGVLVLGIPYFFTAYSELKLPEALNKPGLFVVAVAAGVTVGYGAKTFWKGLLLFGAVAPTVIMLRVVFDEIADPTSHNLWPFEVAIAVGASAPYAFFGAALGWVFFKLSGRQATLEESARD